MLLATIYILQIRKGKEATSQKRNNSVLSVVVGSPMGNLFADYAPSQLLTTTVFFRAVSCTASTGRIEVSTVCPERVILPLVVPVGRFASSTGRFPSIATPFLEAIVASAIMAFATSVANNSVITDESVLQGGRCEYIPINVGRLAGVQYISS